MEACCHAATSSGILMGNVRAARGNLNQRGLQKPRGWPVLNGQRGGLSMADEADAAQDLAEKALQLAIAQARSKANIPAGVSGDCDLCGEWSGRLIEGVCAPCRDHYGLCDAKSKKV